MDKQMDCLEFKNHFDELNAGVLPADRVSSMIAHRTNCAGCAAWSLQMNDIAFMTASLPQFDVSEKLTQNILQAVDNERKGSLFSRHGLMVPASIICLIGVAISPVDSLEGMLSTALGFGGLFLVKALISGAKPGEVVLEA